MTQRVVQKFGGSSVADAEKLRKVARKVQARRAQGCELVVVVSAMGDTTDELLGLARQLSADPPRRELDMLLSCGERISMALLSMALQELGVPAVSFTGSQSGIITDESHAQARIVEVRPTRIVEALGQGKVVIVAGYQGVSRAKEVTTLGRGGSDTSAVALAAALGADCEIYSDVDGVFSADPRVVPEATKRESLSFEEMQELAAAGAKVLNAQAVEFAREAGITIHALSTHAAGTGTRVEATAAGLGVQGVPAEQELWVLAVRRGLGEVLAFLDERAVKPRALLGSPGAHLVLVPLHDVHGPEALAAALGERFRDGLTVRGELGTVSCVGTGLNSSFSVLRGALEEAAALGASPAGHSLTSLQLTLVVPREHLTGLTQRLHRRFVG